MEKQPDLYALISGFERAVLGAALQSKLPPAVVAPVLEKMALRFQNEARAVSDQLKEVKEAEPS